MFHLSQRGKTRRFGLALTIVGAVALATAASGAGRNAAGSTILFGMEASLSGPDSAYGTANRAGAQLAVDQINKAGGLLGKKLKLQPEDNEGKPDVAVSICTKFVSKATVMISSFSYTSIPCTQVTNGKIPQIAMIATSHVLTEKGNKWIFRIPVPDTRLNFDIVKYAVAQGWKKIALLHSNDDYGNGAADATKAAAKKLGAQVVDDETYSNGDRDFSAQVGKVKQANADVVMNFGNYAESAIIAKQLLQFGVKLPHMDGDGAATPDYGKLGGSAVDGVIYGSHWSPSYNYPSNKKFIAAFKAKFRHPPDLFAAEGYTAVEVAADAIKRASSTDPRKVRDAIAKTKLVTPMGPISFNPQGDPTYGTFLVKIIRPGVEKVIVGR
jgi:branched-chain amino acid transport system substrate-binding protein